MSSITMPAIADPAAAAKSYMALGARPKIDAQARAREQAVEFEAVFLNNMFSQMFTGIDGDGPFGGGGKAGVWRSFLTERIFQVVRQGRRHRHRRSRLSLAAQPAGSPRALNSQAQGREPNDDLSECASRRTSHPPERRRR